MSVVYAYNILSDTAEGTVSLSKLNQELEDSLVGRLLGYESVSFSSVPAFGGTTPTEIEVRYSSALLPVNKLLLDAVISAHDGEEPADVELQESNQDFAGNSIENVGTLNGVDFDAFSSNTTTHISRVDNPHDTNLGNLGSGTLSELNAALTDANVDDAGDPRDPNAHAVTHGVSGSDPLAHNTLAGLTVGDPHTQYFNLSRITSWLSARTTDELSEGSTNRYYTEARVNANSNVSANTTHRGRTDNPHLTGLDNLESGTLSDLNALVTDATLDDAGDPRDPNAHAASHAQGGSDELTVQDLGSGGAPSGQLLETDGTGGFSLIPTPSVITDHGSLSGLADDDHPQYIRSDGTRAFNGDADLGGNDVVNVGDVDGVDVSTLKSDFDTHVGQTNPHGTSFQSLSGTFDLSEFNDKLFPETVDAAGTARPPVSHAATHQDGGSDPLSHNSLPDLTVGDPHTQYLNSGRFDTAFSNKDTDELSEGGTNLYYTEARVSANSDVAANTVHRNIVSGNPHGTTASDVGAIPTSQKGANNGVAELDATGKVPTSQIPASALPSFDVVADISARDALVVQEGDEAFVQSNGLFYIFDGSVWFERPVTPGQVSNAGGSTDNAVARFDGVTGQVIQDSTVTISDSGNLSVAGDIQVTGDVDGVNVSALNTNATTHIAQQNNPHNTDIGNLGSGTLAELNSKITDATLDDASDPRDPNAHASTHEQGGSDELTVQNLGSGAAPSGQLLETDGTGGFSLIATPTVITDHGALGGLADDDHPQYVLASGTRAFTGDVDLGTNDVTNVGLVDGVDVSAQATTTNTHIARTDNPHNTDIGNLGSGTLAELNGKITDATLDDASQPRDPNAHASTHSAGGSDPVTAQDLSSGAAPSGRILESNGTGGWVLIPTPTDTTDHGSLSGLGDDDHPQYARTDGGRAFTGNVDIGGNAVVNVSTVDGIDVSAQASTTNTHIARTDNPHNTDIGNLGSGTLAELNGKITDATLDDASQPRDPNAHASTHSAGGSDSLVVQNLSSGGAVADRILVSNGSGGWTLESRTLSQDLNAFAGVTTVNGPTLPTSFAAVPLGAQNLITSAFTHIPGTSNVTVNVAGRYVIIGYGTLENFDSGGRTTSEVRVTRNTGGGFASIPGMTGAVYNRNSSQGRGNASVTTILDLDVGDQLRLEARRLSGNDDIRTVADQCGLVIYAIRGVQGPEGPQGPPGSAITIQDEGASLPGTYDTLNFTGPLVSVANAGGNQTEVNVSLPALDDQQVSASNAVSTTSTTFVDVPDLSITVNNTSSYIAHVSLTSITTNAPVSTSFALYVNGTQVPNTLRSYETVAFVGANRQFTVSFSSLLSLNSGDVVTVRRAVSSATVITIGRSLTVLERR